LLGSFFILFLCLSASYVDNKIHPSDFLDLNRKLFGNFFTKAIMLFFSLAAVIYEAYVLSGFTNLYISTLIEYIPPYVVLILAGLLIVYSTVDGLTYIGRFTELIFYPTAVIILIPVFFIYKGNIINIQPVFQSFNNIIKALTEVIFNYLPMVLAFFFAPFVVNKSNIRKGSIIATILISIFYTLSTLSIFLHMGWEISSKLYYPAIFRFETVDIPVVSDLKAIVLFLYGGIIFKTLSIAHFSVSYCFSHLFKISYRKICVFSYLPVLAFSYFMLGEAKRDSIINPIKPYLILAITSWTISTLVMTFIRSRGEKFEKS
jgi:spore germination protein